MAHLFRSLIRPLLLVLASLLVALGGQATPSASYASNAADPVHHGAELFAETGCAHCHGTAGSGGDRGPDLKNVSRRMTAKAMTTQIHDGGQSMPPFADELKEQEIADLVAYLRAKHKPLPPAKPKESVPPALAPPPNAS